jgi:hypothetical protein
MFVRAPLEPRKAIGLEPFVKSRTTMFLRASLEPRKAIGLEPFVKSRATMFVRAPLEPTKAIGLEPFVKSRATMFLRASLEPRKAIGLEPFVKSRVTMFVRAPLKPRKAIGLVLYQFAHGVSANMIANRFNVGASTMRKYVDIVVVNALISKDKLFSQYISIPHGPCLLRIMHGFFHANGLPNVCGAIDGYHIFLSQEPNKWVITIPTIIIIDEKL